MNTERPDNDDATAADEAGGGVLRGGALVPGVVFLFLLAVAVASVATAVRAAGRRRRVPGHVRHWGRHGRRYGVRGFGRRHSAPLLDDHGARPAVPVVTGERLERHRAGRARPVRRHLAAPDGPPSRDPAWPWCTGARATSPRPRWPGWPKALGVEGAPCTQGEAWKVGNAKDGSGPLLTVSRAGAGHLDLPPLRARHRQLQEAVPCVHGDLPPPTWRLR